MAYKLVNRYGVVLQVNDLVTWCANGPYYKDGWTAQDCVDHLVSTGQYKIYDLETKTLYVPEMYNNDKHQLLINQLLMSSK